MKFRKKPVVIEAFRWDPNLSSWPDWFDDFPDKTVNDNGTVSLLTLEGVMTANRSDYIIRGVKGEVYPCKPDIFEATYECCAGDASGNKATDPTVGACGE